MCKTGKAPEESELALTIGMAQSGSSEAIKALMNKYRPLIDSEVRKYTNERMTSQDITDMRDEAEISFCNAVCSYDISEKNVSFGLYAKICIENGIVSFIRMLNRGKGMNILSLEEMTERNESSSVSADPVQKLIEEENFNDLRRRIQSYLSPYESKVWWMYVSGLRASEIASILGVTDVRSVSNALYRIRKKLREALSKRGQKP